MVYDQEHREPITIGRLDNREWLIVHANVGGENAENFITYKQAQQSKGAKAIRTKQEQEAEIGGIGD